jgi:hypothetical protein
MTEKENILSKYFYGITKRLEIEIDYINEVIGHSGEKGTANEILLRNLLVKFLLKKYSIGSGIVIDRKGGRSNQIDIVVYDSHFHPELFSQGSGFLYPVDVVYMVIEIKTIINKGKMEEAIENISSVKRLDFINSEIFSIKSSATGEPRDKPHFELQPTSPPLGVIFGFKSDTSNFETYDSWIKAKLPIPKREIFDLCYLLNSTFYHAFAELDYKNEITGEFFR